MMGAEKMEIERARVTALVADGVAGVEAYGGDIRFFNAAFLVAAFQLHSEVEGPETIMAALTKAGVMQLKSEGAGST